jgi:hypothetical protein
MRWRIVRRGLAGAGMEWARGAGERRRPTHGRQGKRPARGPAYVVGRIEEFADATGTPCWRFPQIVQAFQGFERRRSDLPPGTPP